MKACSFGEDRQVLWHTVEAMPGQSHPLPIVSVMTGVTLHVIFCGADDGFYYIEKHEASEVHFIYSERCVGLLLLSFSSERRFMQNGPESILPSTVNAGCLGHHGHDDLVHASRCCNSKVHCHYTICICP